MTGDPHSNELNKPAKLSVGREQRHPLVTLFTSESFEKRLASAARMALRTGQYTCLDCYRANPSGRLYLPRPEPVALNDLDMRPMSRTSRKYFDKAPQSYAHALAIKLGPQSFGSLEITDGFLSGLAPSTLDQDDRPIIGLGTVNSTLDGTVALLQRTFARGYSQTAFETVLEQIRGPPLKLSTGLDARDIEERLAVPGYVVAGVVHFEKGARRLARFVDSEIMKRFTL